MPKREGLNADIAPLIRCPADDLALSVVDNELRCADGVHRYPMVDGVPHLIDGKTSVFDVSTIAVSSRKAPTGRFARTRKRLAALLPSPSLNVAAAANYRRLAELLTKQTESTPGNSGQMPVVLVIGGAIEGEGFAALRDAGGVRLVETDVVIGPRTQIVCDAHDLPFASGSFDAVVCQAVLEHVLDPPTVVAEIHRVLKHEGLVYSEIPFMQQVHAGAFDFTRYTLAGHLRLLRDFDEIDSGAACGPGTALVWSLTHFARSLGGQSRMRRELLGAITTMATFWLKYLDRPLANRPAAIDAASATYFLGRRSDRARDDRSIIDAYRGAGCASGL